MGFIAGIASLVQAQLAQSVAPTVLVGKELDVLAAVVLGGASLTGGVGTVLGTILGLTLLAVMQNGLVLLGVSSYWSQFSTGLVILVSVSADRALPCAAMRATSPHEPAHRLRRGARGKSRPSLWRRLRALGVSATNARLVLLLVALVAVFALLVGEQLFSAAALQVDGAISCPSSASCRSQ